jgi:hypothetical protein
VKNDPEDVMLDEEGVVGGAQDERLVERLRMVIVRLKFETNPDEMGISTTIPITAPIKIARACCV